MCQRDGNDHDPNHRYNNGEDRERDRNKRKHYNAGHRRSA